MVFRGHCTEFFLSNVVWSLSNIAGFSTVHKQQHKKIIYNFVWIYLSQHCTSKLLGQYWPIWLTDNVYEENNLCNAVSTLLRQHYLNTCIVLAHSAQTCFRRKTGCSFKWLVACFLAGYNILNNLGSLCSMLPQLFIYDFRDNNEQGPTLTGTSSQMTFWKTNFLSFCE